MSNSIDNRVVQMEFDNAAFEKGVAQSINSLKALHNTIGNLPNNDGFNQVFDNLATNVVSKVSQVKSGFGQIVSTITSGLGTIAKVAGGISAIAGGGIIGMALAGGKRRALNIEQAKFQLQGLKIAWDDVSQSINDAVDGTRYGLDSAAKAASQLAASGVQLGEDMSHALRAISGVASMTNSEYDDIANIFTRVSGQGKLMANDLNSIAARGLNAAATLAKALDTTEADVRELVRKGEIDFMTFANAMNDAFGEESTKANETFTGAMANMRAALNRIGAEFMVTSQMAVDGYKELQNVGGLEAARKIFVAVIPVLNAFRATLAPVVEQWRLFSFHASNAVVAFLNRFREVFFYMKHGEKRLTAFGSGLGTIFKNIVEAVKTFGKPFEALRKSLNITLPKIWDIHAVLKPIRLRIQEITEKMGLGSGAIKLFSRLFKDLGQIISPVTSGLGTFVQDGLNGLIDGYFNLKDKLDAFLGTVAKGMKKNHNVFEKLRDDLTGFVSDKIWGPLTHHATRTINLFKSIWNLISELATEKGLTSWAESLAANIGNAFDTILSYVSPVLDFLKQIGGQAFDFLGGIGNGVLSSFSGIFGEFDWFKNLQSDDATESVENLGDAVEDVEDTLSGSPISRLLEKIGDSVGKFSDILDDGPAHLYDWGDMFRGIRDAVQDFLSEIDLLDKAGEMLNSFKSAMSGFGTVEFTGLGNIVGDNAGLAGFLNSVSKAASDMYGSFRNGLPEAYQVRDVLNKVAEKAKELFDFLAPLGQAIGHAFGDVLQTVGGVITGLIDNTSQLSFSLEPLQNLFGGVVEGLTAFFNSFEGGLPSLDGIVEFIKDLVEALGGFVTDIAPKIGDIGGSISGLIDSFGGLDAISGFATGLKDALDQLNPALQTTSDAVSTVSQSVEKPLNVFSKSLSGVKTAVEQTGDTITKAEDVFGAAADGGIGEKINEFANGINAGVENIIPVALVAAFGYRLYSFTRTTQKLLEGTAGLAGELKKTFRSIKDSMDALKGALESHSSNIGIIRDIVFGVALLVGGLYLLTTVDSDKLWQAVGAIAALAGILTVMGALAVIASSKLKSLNPVVLEGISRSMILMAGAVAILAVAVRLLAGLKIEDLGAPLVAMAASFIALVGAAALMSRAAPQLVKVGAGLLLMAVALAAFGGVIAIFSVIPWGELTTGLTAVGVGLLAFGALARLVGATGRFMLAAAAGVLVLAGALLAFVTVIQVYNNVQWGEMLVGLGTVAVALVAFAVLARGLSTVGPGLVKAAAGFVILAGGVVILTAALMALSVIDSEKLSNAALRLAEVAFVLIGLLAFLGMVSAAGAKAAIVVGSIAAATVAIIAITAALVVLAAIPQEALIKAALALVAVFGALVLFGALTSIGAVGAGLIILAGAILAISVATVVAALGLTGCAAAFALLGAVAPGVANLLAEAMSTMAAAFRENRESLIVLGALVLAAIGLGLALRLAGSGALMAAAGIAALILVIGAAVYAISTFLSTADGTAFVDFGKKIPEGIMQGVQAGFQTVAGFFMGIPDALGNLLQGGFDGQQEKVAESAKQLTESTMQPVESMPATTEQSMNEMDNIFAKYIGEGGSIPSLVSNGMGGMLDELGINMDSFRDMLSNGAIDGSALFGEGFDITQFSDAELSDLVANTDIDLSSLSSAMGGGAADAVGEYESNFTGVSTVTAEEMAKAPEAIAAVDMAGPAQKKAQEGVEGMRKGFTGTREIGVKGANELVSGVRSVNVSEPGRGAGAGIVSGMIAGLNALAPSVYARAEEIAREAANRAKKGAEVNSPSKITIPVGEAIGEGLIVGMERIASRVNDSSEKLGRNAALAVQSAATIMDTVDWDANPVIRPVLDTSAVQSGMQDVNRLLTQQSMLNTVGYANRSLEMAASSSSSATTNTYYFSLDYKAGEDPNNLLRKIGNSIRYANASKG